jgi:hypothetical protein
MNDCHLEYITKLNPNKKKNGLEYKENFENSNWHTHQVLNHSKHTQNEKDMQLEELERGLELFFFVQKTCEANYHSSSSYCFLHCSFTSEAQKKHL